VTVLGPRGEENRKSRKERERIIESDKFTRWSFVLGGRGKVTKPGLNKILKRHWGESCGIIGGENDVKASIPKKKSCVRESASAEASHEERSIRGDQAFEMYKGGGGGNGTRGEILQAKTSGGLPFKNLRVVELHPQMTIVREKGEKDLQSIKGKT